MVEINDDAPCYFEIDLGAMCELSAVTTKTVVVTLDAEGYLWDSLNRGFAIIIR